ncbi:general stress protein [Aneurinibacillus migulanus]|uniref:general stress protein n=1 Tax=Aneurinibacillus migulanus TaxID=47500 RepID=UPI002E2091F6|nr:general stress protein [Aneurinibacillus migulanus]
MTGKPFVQTVNDLYQVEQIVRYLKDKGYTKDDMYITMRSEKQQIKIAQETNLRPLSLDKSFWDELTSFYATREKEMVDHLIRLGLTEAEANNHVAELAQDYRKILILAKTKEADEKSLRDYIASLGS